MARTSNLPPLNADMNKQVPMLLGRAGAKYFGTGS